MQPKVDLKELKTALQEGLSTQEWEKVQNILKQFEPVEIPANLEWESFVSGTAEKTISPGPLYKLILSTFPGRDGQATLIRFCEIYFPVVSNNATDEMDKSRIADDLLSYAERFVLKRMLMGLLLAFTASQA